MTEVESPEELWDEMLNIMRKQSQETPEQKADRWEKIARHVGQSEDEVQSLRAEILGRLH